jgi:hypothetical protein
MVGALSAPLLVGWLRRNSENGGNYTEVHHHGHNIAAEGKRDNERGAVERKRDNESRLIAQQQSGRTRSSAPQKE